MTENIKYADLIKKLERNGWKYDATKKRGRKIYLFFFREVDEEPVRLELPPINYSHTITEAADGMTVYGYSLRVTVSGA